MASPMISTQFRAIVEPILNEPFDGVYDLRKDEWKQMFREESGIPREYHEEPVLSGFGAAPVLPEGMPVTYDSAGTLYIARYEYLVIGLAFALTKVLVEDGNHIRIGRIFSEQLAQSLIQTKEVRCANVLNRGFNGSYVGGDGVSLFNASHPAAVGTYSNLLTAANLSQTSLEQGITQVMQAVDFNQKQIRLDVKKLAVAPANALQAEVLLKSVLRTGTANNDINPIKTWIGELEPAIMTRLTSPNAWFLGTNAPQGLKLMTRRAVDKSMEGDFETDSMRYKATERYREGWTDPKGAYGNAGL